MFSIYHLDLLFRILPAYNIINNRYDLIKFYPHLSSIEYKNNLYNFLIKRNCSGFAPTTPLRSNSQTGFVRVDVFRLKRHHPKEVHTHTHPCTVDVIQS